MARPLLLLGCPGSAVELLAARLSRQPPGRPAEHGPLRLITIDRPPAAGELESLRASRTRVWLCPLPQPAAPGARDLEDRWRTALLASGLDFSVVAAWSPGWPGAPGAEAASPGPEIQASGATGPQQAAAQASGEHPGCLTPWGNCDCDVPGLEQATWARWRQYRDDRAV
ncbi:hypothetical protein [Ideonella livida]|uniref:Uncharacterized protein n=1 Tax=Ideonella livida TaxID=2707176 RepID=A0A7C9TJ66_9BURK|nr:hypothetical protein [Ideonella livida]NDY90824.1 hypothetical protein [Ideonella livida]